jgi:DNA-binding GntR family transcriptional regulator
MAKQPQDSPQAPARRAPVQRQVLGDGVFDAITELLLDKTFEPGDRLSVDQLARDLGVSQTPIREALARIESSGLVVRKPMRGYTVAPRMSQEDVMALLDARLLIEPHNTAQACERGDPALLPELEKAFEAMLAAPVGPGYHEFRPFLEADAEFHAIVGRHCGNAFLARAVESFDAHLRRFSLFGDRGVDDSEISIREHRAILEAFRAGKALQAGNAMRQHLEGVRGRALAKTSPPAPPTMP